MRTGQEIFDVAVRLMDAQNETTGATDTADTREYRVRAVSLLNSILDRAYPSSDNYPDPESGKRPVAAKLETLDDPVEMDDYICLGILPYGLAGLLLTEESPAMSDFFWQTFLEQLELAKRSMPAAEGSVEDTYGFLGDCLEYGQFSRWG